MGFEVFVGVWHDGKPSGISKAAVLALFPVDEAQQDSDFWQLRYDARNTCQISLRVLPDDATQITGFCVERPCGDIRLWNALMDVLRLGNVVLFWPGDEPPIVADQSVIAHLPDGMIEALGKPKCVQTGQEILWILRPPKQSDELN